MGKDTGGNRKQGRGGAGAAPQQAGTPGAPEPAPTSKYSFSGGKVNKATAAEANGVKLGSGANTMTAGQTVIISKAPSNIPAGPDPWRLRDKTTNVMIAKGKDSASLLAFAKDMALEVVPEK